MGWITFAGVSYGNIFVPLLQIGGSFIWQALVKPIHRYPGYYNAFCPEAEIKDPGKNIPQSMFINVINIAIVHLAMNLNISSVFPLQEFKSWQGTGKDDML